MITIFLDIDGVIATHKEFFTNRNKFYQKNPIAKELGIPYPFNKGCVEILNDLLDEFECQIVLSSDWKLHYNLEELNRIFIFNGVKQSPIDITEDFRYSGLMLSMWRASEIKAYIDKNNIDKWITIDDLLLGGWFKDFNDEDKCFLTVDTMGLKQSGLKDKIIKKLNEWK